MNIAFIPARSGSTRVPHKNIESIGGEPLLGRAVRVAKTSGCFDRVYVVTDDEKYFSIGSDFGADACELRPADSATADAPDFEWVRWAYQQQLFSEDDVVAILRPTSPFRSAKSIVAAVELLNKSPNADSVRGMVKADKHPAKSWIINERGYASSLLPFSSQLAPWHSSQSNTLPTVYNQNAALEVVRGEAIIRTQSISGDIVLGFVMSELESIDINTTVDLEFARFVEEWKAVGQVE